MRPAFLIPPILLLAALTGACEDTVAVAPDLLQLRVVIVDSTAYAPMDLLAEAEGAVGDRYAEVTRLVDCSGGVWVRPVRDDGPADYCPLREGESNYLPAGTPIYRIQGVEPEKALTVFHEEQWEVLRPLNQTPEDTWST